MRLWGLQTRRRAGKLSPCHTCAGPFSTAVSIHFNPVRRGLVKDPEDWKGSSLREFAGVSGEDQERVCGLRIDRVPLPFDIQARL